MYRVKFTETFTLIVRRESLRIFFIIVTLYNLKLHEINIKAVYLSEDLQKKKEEI